MKSVLFSATLLASSIASAAAPVDGWYAGAFGGYAYFPSNISRDFWGFTFTNSASNGYNVGARLGYQSNPIRYELEYTYLRAQPDTFSVNHFKQNGVSGNANANVGMANIYYDFPDVILPTISPFLGVGIGYAYIQTSLNGTGPFGFTFFSEKANSFAYQGTAGLTYNFSENWALNASYRYLATTSNSNFGKPFQAQIGDAGVVYRFDQCDYK
jgi:opacity protein-like surface antigen